DAATIRQVVRTTSVDDRAAELRGILARNSRATNTHTMSRPTPAHTRQQTVANQQHQTAGTQTLANTGRRTIDIGGHTFEMIIVQPDSHQNARPAHAAQQTHSARPTHTPSLSHADRVAQRQLAAQLNRVRMQRDAESRPDPRQQLAAQLNAERQRREREAAQDS
ncbi:MAG: hypothetical protein AAF235_11530, partial [Planctomycetota bacterium]